MRPRRKTRGPAAKAATAERWTYQVQPRWGSRSSEDMAVQIGEVLLELLKAARVSLMRGEQARALRVKGIPIVPGSLALLVYPENLSGDDPLPLYACTVPEGAPRETIARFSAWAWATFPELDVLPPIEFAEGRATLAHHPRHAERRRLAPFVTVPWYPGIETNEFDPELNSGALRMLMQLRAAVESEGCASEELVESMCVAGIGAEVARSMLDIAIQIGLFVAAPLPNEQWGDGALH